MKEVSATKLCCAGSRLTRVTAHTLAIYTIYRTSITYSRVFVCKEKLCIWWLPSCCKTEGEDNQMAVKKWAKCLHCYNYNVAGEFVGRKDYEYVPFIFSSLVTHMVILTVNNAITFFVTESEQFFYLLQG